MEFAFGFAVFVIGFAMLMAGIGLLIGGEIVFKSGKKIPKPVGRKAGIVLVSFFPLVSIALFMLRKLVPVATIPSAVVSWPLVLVCVGLAGVWVRRGMAASQSQRGISLSPAAQPFGATEPASPSEPILLEFDVPDEPPPEAPASIPPRSKPRAQNPFDFS